MTTEEMKMKIEYLNGRIDALNEDNCKLQQIVNNCPWFQKYIDENHKTMKKIRKEINEMGGI